MSLIQLSQVLPLPEEDLRQLLNYASTLSKAEAASHFGTLLGDSPLAVDFIASFNSSRKDPTSTLHTNAQHGASSAGGSAPPSDRETVGAAPKGKKYQKKKKTNIHQLEARKVEEYPAPGTAYSKGNSDLEYIPQRASAPTSSHASRSTTPKPAGAVPQTQQPPKQPSSSSSAGYLISEIPSKSKAKSQPPTRSSTPKPPTKVSLVGGTPMAGQSTALSDLDAAIRALEITTNPRLNVDSGSKESINARKCSCVATRHPLLNAAPNCLSCGQVICLRQGLGPCTFCGTPLLKSEDVQKMIRELKDERGREKMKADKESHKRAEVSKKPLPFHPIKDGISTPPAGMDSVLSAEEKARAHRDKLLNFQSQNAQRTTVHDEAADFDYAPSGLGSMWASPEERARELKKQQKMMREIEWHAKPEWEKRKQVLSIDLVGGKVVRKMVGIERPESPPEEDEPTTPPEPGYDTAQSTRGRGGGGAFSKNPLLGGLIKPVFEVDEKGKGAEVQSRRERQKWRRVQNDLDDNEDIILDGGIRGHQDVVSVGDGPECG